ncbi:VOC family protein [Planctomicrobium sp. SH661]|uniref:VOC family protein n=1 Tax=Planctomicrobium sp. SH661 TaxID=3448124 RepID=UPI003F5B5AE6
MLVQPYLNFDGRCEEALEYYHRALGAEILMLMRFKDSPEACDPSLVPTGNENKVMHASFRVGNSVLMASDCGCQGNPVFQGISLSLNVESDAEARRLFDALGTNGEIQVPLAPTFFASSFGVVLDRFGISWMIVKQTGQD